MAKKERKWELNRKQYQLIRKMDHQEMQAYLNEVYENGVIEGRKDAKPFDTLLALSEIKKAKGIGSAKLEMIYKAMLAAGATDLNKRLDEMEEELRVLMQGINN